MCVFVCVWGVRPAQPPLAQINTRLIHKLIKDSLNSEFSFF